MTLSPKKNIYPVSLLGKFEQNISLLKKNIDSHNQREVMESADAYKKLGLCNRQYFLKKISEPRYNKVSAKTMRVTVERKKAKAINEKQISSLKQQTDQNMNFSNSIMMTETALKDSSALNERYMIGLKKKLKSKQRKLQLEWIKTQNYRSQNSISDYPPISKNKKENIIIQKIKRSRPVTTNKYQYCNYSRNDTSTSIYSYL